jgi:hypothetical protein
VGRKEKNKKKKKKKHKRLVVGLMLWQFRKSSSTTPASCNQPEAILERRYVHICQARREKGNNGKMGRGELELMT